MSEWEALVGDDFLMRGIRVAWRRDLVDGQVEYTDGKSVWQSAVTPGVEPDVDPLFLRDDQARALLAALLRHYNGADDARMLRKDCDAERARVDRLMELFFRQHIPAVTPRTGCAGPCVPSASTQQGGAGPKPAPAALSSE